MIATTAHAMQEGRQRGMDAGMDACLTQPMDPDALGQEEPARMDPFPSTVPDAASSFDEAGFLPRLLGNREAAFPFNQVFLNGFPRRMALLQEALAAERLSRQHHTLKSATASLGAEGLRTCLPSSRQGSTPGTWRPCAPAYRSFNGDSSDCAPS